MAARRGAGACGRESRPPREREHSNPRGRNQIITTFGFQLFERIGGQVSSPPTTSALPSSLYRRTVSRRATRLEAPPRRRPFFAGDGSNKKGGRRNTTEQWGGLFKSIFTPDRLHPRRTFFATTRTGPKDRSLCNEARPEVDALQGARQHAIIFEQRGGGGG